MENVINALLNCLLVSIPEEFVWVCLTLIFLKRFDLLDRYRWRENIKWIMIPIIITALSSNICRFVLDTPKIIMFLSSQIIMYILIIYIVKKTSFVNDKISYLKILLFMFLASLVIGLTESIYYPLALNISNIQLNELMKNQIMIVLFSIPSRIFQLILIWILMKNNNILEKKLLFENIFKNKVITLTTIIFIGIILLIMFFSILVFGDLNLIKHYSLLSQVIITILITVVPIILITLYFIPINYFLNIIENIKISYQQMFDNDI